MAGLGLSLAVGCGPAAPDLPELPLLYVGNVWGGNLAVSEGRVYFTTFYHGPEEDQAVWSMPAEHYGSFVAQIPAPLGIGSIELADGTQVQGFLCEAAALAGAEDISHHGGWRAYVASRA